MKKNNTIPNKKLDNSNKEIDDFDAGTSYESNLDNSFFYTNDKFLTQLDYIDIISCISKKFKNLNDANSDLIIKKTIIQLLDDEKFIIDTLNYYNITIYDLFKLIYMKYASVFKGPFLKKIKNRIQDKKYLKNVRIR